MLGSIMVECPLTIMPGILYAIVARADAQAPHVLEQAVLNLLQSIGEQTVPRVLWSMRYQQHYVAAGDAPSAFNNVITLKSLPPDLAIDDSTLDHVKLAWQRIVDADQDSFLKFEAREGTMEVDELG